MDSKPLPYRGQRTCPPSRQQLVSPRKSSSHRRSSFPLQHCSLLLAAHYLRISHLLDNLDPSLDLIKRGRMGIFPWFCHKDKVVVKVLHRLRSDRNRLNRWAFFWDPVVLHRNCAHGCLELEESYHVIIICPHYNPNRNKLENLLSRNNLAFNLNNILGLNPDIPSSLQFKIRDHLICYLRKSEIFYRI